MVSSFFDNLISEFKKSIQIDVPALAHEDNQEEMRQPSEVHMAFGPYQVALEIRPSDEE